MGNAWRHGTRQRRTLRDFHRARYGNPLFSRAGVQRRARPAGPSLKPWIFGVLLASAVVGAAWYLFWGPAFRITTVEITGISGPTEDAVRAALQERMGTKAFFVLPGDDILVFDRSKTLDQIAKRVYLDSISLRKKLPGTIEIEAKEKTMRAALEQGDRLYALDETGFVLRELSDKEIAMLGDLPPGMNAVQVQGLGAVTVDLGKPSTAGAAAKAAPQNGKPAQAPPPDQPKQPPLPLIIGASADPTKGIPNAAAGQAMFSPATMRTVLQANARLSDVAGTPIRWFQVDESAETVDADMMGDWLIRLSSAAPFDVQAERLGIVLKDTIGARRTDLQYVDLRYNERIFYRLKDGSPAK